MTRPYYVLGLWPHRLVCALLGGHQFLRSHSFTHLLICARCKKAERVNNVVSAEELALRAAKRETDGARRMGFSMSWERRVEAARRRRATSSQVNRNPDSPEVA